MGLIEKIKIINPLIGKWSKKDSLLYIIAIPMILILIFLLPDEIRQHFILDLHNPTIFSIFANHYTHSAASHLGNNLGVYLFAIFAIFNIETDKNRFYKVSAVLFFALSVVSSLLMMNFLSGLPPVQGFSAIGSGFVGYVIYAVYSFLRKHFDFVKPTLFSIVIMINLLTLVVVNNYSAGLTALLALTLGVLLVTSGKDIIALAKEGLVNFRKLPKGIHLEIIYKSSVIASCIILALALPFLVPATIVHKGNITNIVAHYFGWVLGISLPLLFDSTTAFLRSRNRV